MWNLKSIRQPLDIVHNGTWDVCYAEVPVSRTYTVYIEAEYATNAGSVEAILFAKQRTSAMPPIPRRIVKVESRNESIRISSTDGLQKLADWGLVPRFPWGWVNRTAAIRYQNQNGVKIYADSVQINN